MLTRLNAKFVFILVTPHLSSPHPQLLSTHLSYPHLTYRHLSSHILTSYHLSSHHLISPIFTSPHLSSTHRHLALSAVTCLASLHIAQPSFHRSFCSVVLHVVSGRLTFLFSFRRRCCQTMVSVHLSQHVSYPIAVSCIYSCTGLHVCGYILSVFVCEITTYYI